MAADQRVLTEGITAEETQPIRPEVVKLCGVVSIDISWALAINPRNDGQ